MVQPTQASGASRASVSCGIATATMVLSIELINTARPASAKKRYGVVRVCSILTWLVLGPPNGTPPTRSQVDVARYSRFAGSCGAVNVAAGWWPGHGDVGLRGG